MLLGKGTILLILWGGLAHMLKVKPSFFSHVTSTWVFNFFPSDPKKMKNKEAIILLCRSRSNFYSFEHVVNEIFRILEKD
jgi:hypothetical protein